MKNGETKKLLKDSFVGYGSDRKSLYEIIDGPDFIAELVILGEAHLDVYVDAARNRDKKRNQWESIDTLGAEIGLSIGQCIRLKDHPDFNYKTSLGLIGRILDRIVTKIEGAKDQAFSECFVQQLSGVLEAR